jgi:arginase
LKHHQLELQVVEQEQKKTWKVGTYPFFQIVRGGLTLREGTELLRSVHRTGRLSAVDIVEVNPLLGSASDLKITLDAARHLAAAAAGYYPGGWAPKGVTDIPQS